MTESVELEIGLARNIRQAFRDSDQRGRAFIVEKNPFDNDPNTSQVAWVQVVSSSGIPARSGGRPGRGNCYVLKRATESGTGVQIDDLVRTSQTIEILNYRLDIAGAEGDRLVMTSGHEDGVSEVIDWECSNTGVPADIKNEPVSNVNQGFRAAQSTTTIAQELGGS